MDQKALARFKRVLLEEKQKVLNSSRKNIEDIKLSTDDMADETDHAVSELSQNLALTLRDRERLLLSMIDAALDRIENGTFGHCESCEEDIELKRLDARPMTTLCFSCQEEKEHRQKIFA